MHLLVLESDYDHERGGEDKPTKSPYISVSTYYAPWIPNDANDKVGSVFFPLGRSTVSVTDSFLPVLRGQQFYGPSHVAVYRPQVFLKSFKRSKNGEMNENGMAD